MINSTIQCDRPHNPPVTAAAPDGEPPDDWLQLFTIAKGQGEDGRRRERHLCPTCKALLRNFIQGQAVSAL